MTWQRSLPPHRNSPTMPEESSETATARVPSGDGGHGAGGRRDAHRDRPGSARDGVPEGERGAAGPEPLSGVRLASSRRATSKPVVEGGRTYALRQLPKLGDRHRHFL